MLVRYASQLALAYAILVVLTHSAKADAVDGHWCSPNDHQLFIDGSVVIINDLSETNGDYGRHHYVFEMPEDEFMGGSQVDLVLISPNIAHVRYISKTGDELNKMPEVWTRCSDSIS